LRGHRKVLALFSLLHPPLGSLVRLFQVRLVCEALQALGWK
jgi:hypothetical protein